MNTIATKKDELTKIYRKSISANYKIWAEELYFYLKEFDIDKSECRIIAICKASFVAETFKRMRKGAFAHIQSLEYAFAIYCAHIRHSETNYDDFCAEVSKRFREDIDKDTLLNLWQKCYRADYDYYKHKCAILRNKVQERYNVQLVY